MNIVNDNSDITKTGTKPEIEQVEQKKQEYYLLGTFLRTRGLKLFGYNHLEKKVFPVDIVYSNTIHVVPEGNGSLKTIDFEAEKTTVDSRFEYFEAMCLRTAKNRVDKYLQGKITKLCNLRKPDNSIKMF